ncbi:Trypsin-like protein serine protease typically periplasmic contain C-terminal PDZ domain-like protein [Gloeothece citriformis PCC 7424]|uniref:Serine protease n=1 Tax=Gloeothece citriformis (strain PCC 7424) TaxID=65393 RepID=B7KID8_GLOC7|nr:serine protease [Gloeothece citriformis]ACK73625.1 Trypsin-like protein serine protease typically periplasmic contain C-terminal PDZ domain-like protein [Gloeothece citriformis PCC 7424]
MNDEELKECTVRIHWNGNKGHEGTGFFVSPRLILTCHHVIKSAKNSPVNIFWNDKPYTAEIKQVYPQIDLAILEIDSLDKFPQVQLDESVKIGDNLYTFGYPDNYPSGDRATFQCEGMTGDERPLIKFKAGQVRPGFSGSPLLNLATGKVCGIIIKTRDRNTDLGGRAIPIFEIFKVFPQLKIIDKLSNLIENPFIPLTGMINSLNLFFGREKDLKDAFEILNSGSSVAFIGEKAIGKSSLIWAMYLQAEKFLQVPRQPVYINLAEEVYHEDDFYTALCDKVGIPVCKGYLLSRELKSRRVLLFLDEVENMSWDGFTNPLRSQLRGLANKGSQDACLRLVIAANKPLNQLFCDSNIVSPFENICIEIFLQPWDEATIRRFIESRLSSTNCRFTEEEILELIEDTKGFPQKLMQKCYKLYKVKAGS